MSSFGFGGSNSHVVLDDAHHFLRMRNLCGNHNTVPEPPSPGLLGHVNIDSISGDHHLNGTSDASGHSKQNGAYDTDRTIHSLNGTTPLPNGTTANNGICNKEKISPRKVLLIEADDTSVSDQKILVWSAADEDGISRIAAIWDPYFSSLSIPDAEKSRYLSELAHTLATRRSNMPWKTFALVNSALDLQSTTAKFAPPIRSISSPGLAFIFTGVS